MANKSRKFHKEKNKKSLMSGASEKQIRENEFLISFKHLDREQGQTLTHWEENKILAQSIETLRGYCGQSLQSQINDKFTIYGDFPPSSKTEFHYPKHVPEDAEWARLHVTGKICIIGHIVRNVFNIVFLDMDHRFWISEKKHT